MIVEKPGEWCSLGSLALVYLYDQIPTPCNNSLVHLFSRKNDLSKVHACMADFTLPGYAPVYFLQGPPFLLQSNVLSTDGVWP